MLGPLEELAPRGASFASARHRRGPMHRGAGNHRVSWRSRAVPQSSCTCFFLSFTKLQESTAPKPARLPQVVTRNPKRFKMFCKRCRGVGHSIASLSLWRKRAVRWPRPSGSNGTTILADYQTEKKATIHEQIPTEQVLSQTQQK